MPPPPPGENVTWGEFSGLVGPSRNLESLLSRKTAAPLLDVRYATSESRATAPLGTLRKTWSQVDPGIWRGRAWHGRAGQAFELVEFSVVDRATANSPPRTAAGHKQGDQTAKTKPPVGSCSRILDQSLGSTRARSSRNRPLECPGTMAGVARGWAGRSLPLTPNATHFASNTRSGR
jgi:hypothetical protein